MRTFPRGVGKGPKTEERELRFAVCVSGGSRKRMNRVQTSVSELYARPHPGPVASQARHQMVAPTGLFASRNVVPRGEGESSAVAGELHRWIFVNDHRAEAAVLVRGTQLGTRASIWVLKRRERRAPRRSVEAVLRSALDKPSYGLPIWKSATQQVWKPALRKNFPVRSGGGS